MAEEEKEENGSSFLQKSGVLLSDITYFTSETELIHALIAETKVHEQSGAFVSCLRIDLD